MFAAVAHVHWALRAPRAKPTSTTAKTMTVRTEPPVSMESTTTLVFVPPTTQVSPYSSLTQEATGTAKMLLAHLLYSLVSCLADELIQTVSGLTM